MTADRDLDHDRVASSEQELSEALTTIENLNQALVNARVIGAAVGILMSQLKLPYDAAFETLARASQSRNVKLRALAENVMLTGSL